MLCSGKLFASTVHPITSQVHDRQVLAHGWDDKLKNHLQEEKIYFEDLNNLKDHLNTLGMND